MLSKEVSKGNLASPTSCRIDQPKDAQDIILVCCGNCLFQDRKECFMFTTVNSPNSGHFGTTVFVFYLECPLLGSFVKFMLNNV